MERGHSTFNQEDGCEVAKGPRPKDLTMLYLLRAAWWKLRPPPIPSPYLHSPRFAKEFEAILTHYARNAKRIIEFGCLHGFSTAILARATNGMVHSYDTFERSNIFDVRGNMIKADLGDKVILHQYDFNLWLVDPSRFDLMYVDVRNTPEILRKIYYALFKEIKAGTPILFEGAARLKLVFPHRVLCPLHPGLGLML